MDTKDSYPRIVRLIWVFVGMFSDIETRICNIKKTMQTFLDFDFLRKQSTAYSQFSNDENTLIY